MADIPANAAASPGHFSVAVVAAGIDNQWKRRRDAASPPARRAAGGATAPMTVAVSTPPAQRQRTIAFNLTGADIDAKLGSFKTQVIEEFVRVHSGIGGIQAGCSAR